ncbi:hypothetical protein OKW30_002786 [Paraburkholderia sp. Clong3]|uniref:hypothetical protein n=1 Tax=Paraburkholderia sp. Clong3 TaxID=2991061 RepID=UPI003D25C172
MRLKSAVASLLISISTIAVAQQPTKAAVFVEDHTEDNQGHRLAYAVKEQIRNSAGMRIVDTPGESALQVHLGSIDATGSQIQTAFTVVYTLTDFGNPGSFQFYLDSTGGLCGAQAIDQCANSIVARLDTNLSSVRAAFAAAVKK